jgi:hypothetical protein
MDSILPQPGDVIIHRQVHSPAVYVLSTLNEALQLSCKTYADALDRATAFAMRAHRDAWYTTDEQIFKRIGQYRPAS